MSDLNQQMETLEQQIKSIKSAAQFCERNDDMRRELQHAATLERQLQELKKQAGVA